MVAGPSELLMSPVGRDLQSQGTLNTKNPSALFCVFFHYYYFGTRTFLKCEATLPEVNPRIMASSDVSVVRARRRQKAFFLFFRCRCTHTYTTAFSAVVQVLSLPWC